MRRRPPLRYVAPPPGPPRCGASRVRSARTDGPVRDRRNHSDRARAIPPAWTDVWICPAPNGHIQAVGRDARGRKQYRYHSRWREIRDETKYARMIDFGRALPRIRRRVQDDVSRAGLPREKVLAAVVGLLETTLIRVGNEEYARQNGSYGLTTLRAKHVRVDGCVCGSSSVAGRQAARRRAPPAAGSASSGSARTCRHELFST